MELETNEFVNLTLFLKQMHLSNFFSTSNFYFESVWIFWEKNFFLASVQARGGRGKLGHRVSCTRWARLSDVRFSIAQRDTRLAEWLDQVAHDGARARRH
jgi:hypothetical protein